MKKILCILMLCACLGLAMPAWPGTVTVTVSTPVSLDAANWKSVPISGTGAVALQCRTAVDVYIATSASPGVVYWTIKSGSALTLDLKLSGDAGIYAKAASGPVWLEIIYLSND